MSTELTFEELDLQQAELLPAREALAHFNYANVYATNTAVALNAASYFAKAKAVAVQKVFVLQG